MTWSAPRPRILVIDDVFGRVVRGGRNRERANLCAQYGLLDVTEAPIPGVATATIKNPVAEAVFFRGQSPVCSGPGDRVENDLDACMRMVAAGWDGVAPDGSRWALVLLDLCFYTGEVTPESDRRVAGMPEGRPADSTAEGYFGLRLLSELQSRFPGLPTIMFSSKPRDEVSRAFALRGALAFLPRASEDGPELLAEYLDRHGLTEDSGGRIVGRSTRLLTTLRDARRAASGRRNLLFRGERGTGKELLGDYVRRSRRPQPGGELVIVNAGGLSPELYGSELFGHKRGAFTGAIADRVGAIGALVNANGDDLYLDEIGNMPVAVQMGLLRAIEYGEVLPIGADTSTKVSVRFLSATNSDLDAEVVAGRFRADLLDRLREGGTLHLPPLRDRREDVPLLAQYFIESAAAALGAMRRTIERDAMEALVAHSWPGNVRELRTVLFEVVRSYRDVEYLVLHHLPANIRDAAAGRVQVAETSASTADRAERVPPGILDTIVDSHAREMLGYLRAALAATRRSAPGKLDGRVLIQPAVRFMTGDAKLRASKAADVVKRIVDMSAVVRAEALSDAAVREAYETATRLRPRHRGSATSRPGIGSQSDA